MSKKLDDIPGIYIRAFKINDNSINCNLRIMMGDAKDLCTRNNKELEEWLIVKLCEKFEEVLENARTDS